VARGQGRRAPGGGAVNGPGPVRYRRTLALLGELLESAGQEQLLHFIEDALTGDRYAEMHCGAAISAAIRQLRLADAVERAVLDTPLTPQGTPQ
jgi:hypothetical protein